MIKVLYDKMIDRFTTHPQNWHANELNDIKSIINTFASELTGLQKHEEAQKIRLCFQLEDLTPAIQDSSELTMRMSLY